LFLAVVKLTKKTFFIDMVLCQRAVSSWSFETTQWPHIEGFKCLLQHFNISRKIGTRLPTDVTSYQQNGKFSRDSFYRSSARHRGRYMFRSPPWIIKPCKRFDILSVFLFKNFFNTVPISTHFNDLNNLPAWNVNYALSKDWDINKTTQKSRIQP
jgi:hypothetical protein